jgi:hypothetical protein
MSHMDGKPTSQDLGNMWRRAAWNDVALALNFEINGSANLSRRLRSTRRPAFRL